MKEIRVRASADAALNEENVRDDVLLPSRGLRSDPLPRHSPPPGRPNILGPRMEEDPSLGSMEGRMRNLLQ